jgi:hypothetical protein
MDRQVWPVRPGTKIQAPAMGIWKGVGDKEEI